MRDHYFDEIQAWYVVFLKRALPRTRLIHWFVCSEFAHVIMVRENPKGGSIVINPSDWGTSVRFIEETPEEYLTIMAPHSTAILSYVADYRRCVQYRFRGVYTCVTLCKTILGVWGCWSQFPKGLYKFLLKRGGTTIVKAYIPYLPKAVIV